MTRRHFLLLTILLAGLLLRLAAMAVQPFDLSDADAHSYALMAATAFEAGGMRDIWGNHAFYSPGYPIALAPLVALFGAKAGVVLGANLGFAAAAILLAELLGYRLGGKSVGLIAAAITALLAPAALATALVARENLSVPLLLGFAIACVALLETRRPRLWSIGAGIAYGAGMLAGASVILTGAALPLALWWRGERRAMLPALALFAGATGAVLLPWLWHTQDVLGRPVLTTNAPFNLYVGNNPNATGRFVSMRDSPLGAEWKRMHARLGELAATDELGRLARAHIAAHPVQTAALSATKLLLFWLPDPPGAGDRHGALVTLLRWGEIAQHLLLLALAGVTLARWRGLGRGARLVAAIIALFWAVHAAAYVMPRYRLPAMPLVGALAALGLVPLLERRVRRREALA
ncbi:MAG: hypothetical protein A4S16_03330 [Proteobacteria bacterium SG_bin6]|nr:MAG: hypothetical protein A4S16_03330 [Proteobacteria bacterium SG_bin6]